MLALMWLQERQRRAAVPRQILQVVSVVPHSNSGAGGSSSILLVSHDLKMHQLTARELATAKKC